MDFCICNQDRLSGIILLMVEEAPGSMFGITCVSVHVVRNLWFHNAIQLISLVN